MKVRHSAKDRSLRAVASQDELPLDAGRQARATQWRPALADPQMAMSSRRLRRLSTADCATATDTGWERALRRRQQRAVPRPGNAPRGCVAVPPVWSLRDRHRRYLGPAHRARLPDHRQHLQGLHRQPSGDGRRLRSAGHHLAYYQDDYSRHLGTATIMGVDNSTWQSSQSVQLNNSLAPRLVREAPASVTPAARPSGSTPPPARRRLPWWRSPRSASPASAPARTCPSAPTSRPAQDFVYSYLTPTKTTGGGRDRDALTS